MRRLVLLPLFVVLGVAVSAGQPVVAAAAAPSVTMTLLGQSAWNGPGRPLVLKVAVTNRSDAALGGLSISLTIGAPTTSRSLYELSLRQDATSDLVTHTTEAAGSLDPGQTRTFAVRQDLADLAGRPDSSLYPLRVEFRSQDVTQATIRTPMVFLTEAPKVPLNFAWTWVLADPLQIGPDGVFGPGPIEQDVAPGGRLDAMVSALDRPRAVAADVAVSPVLLEELTSMANGYRIDANGSTHSVVAGTGGAADAARVLGGLTRVAGRPSTELVALPFGDATIPSIIHGHLGDLLTSLIERGRGAVQGEMGAPVTTTVARPLLSQLDPATLVQLADRGVGVVLVDPGFVPTPDGLPFSPPAVGHLTFGGRSVAAVLPDTGVATVARAVPGDPLLSAHASLGELAATWLELPGTPGRGAAMLFPERSTYPAAFYAAMANLVGASAWLHPIRASDLVTTLTDQAAERLTPREYPRFDPAYLARLEEAQSELAQFDASLVGGGHLKESFANHLLAAVAGTFVTQPSLGDRYIAAVTTAIRRTFAKVSLPVSGPLTLTSRRGSLPLTILNGTAYPIRARVRLVADARLAFADGGSRLVTIPPGGLTVQFPVDAKTTGRIYLQVVVQTRGGLRITGAQLVVRSTAYNRVALVVTIGAALFLAVWWGRRFLPKRTST